MSLAVYSNQWCPFAQRVRITLQETKAPAEIVEVDLENKPDWFLRANPRGEVPVLRLPSGEHLFESAVIAQYLAEEYEAPAGLVPTNALDRARDRLFQAEFDRFVGALYRQVLPEQGTPEYKEAVSGYLDAARRVNDALLARSPEGPFVAGANFTFPDLLAAPFLARVKPVATVTGASLPDTPEYARFHAWSKAVLERPSVKATSGTEQELTDVYFRWQKKRRAAR